uniref:Uncharacterized protein n=1 Tax=Anguilla anguilla TaxID=7936 RepID=A0A0E9U1C8_ANGAN
MQWSNSSFFKILILGLISLNVHPCQLQMYLRNSLTFWVTFFTHS